VESNEVVQTYPPGGKGLGKHKGSIGCILRLEYKDPY